MFRVYDSPWLIRSLLCYNRLCLYDSPWLIRSTTSTMVLRLVLGDQGGFTSVGFSGRYRAVRADQGQWSSLNLGVT